MMTKARRTWTNAFRLYRSELRDGVVIEAQKAVARRFPVRVVTSGVSVRLAFLVAFVESERRQGFEKKARPWNPLP